MERITEEFMELIQIDSDSAKEREMADALSAKLREIGCDVFEDDAHVHLGLGGNAGNVYGVLPGSLPGALLFTAHMDRVPGGKGIKPRIENGRIVSDGTILAADDISGVAAILDGLRRIKSSGDPHPRIEVIFSVCEEIAVSGSRHFDYSRLQSKQAYVIDSPGRIGRVLRSAPSKCRIKIEVFGKTAHAGNCPEAGINAVMAAAKLLASIQDGRIDAETTANISSFQAACSINVVNDYAQIEGETRSRSQQKLDAYLDELERAREAVAAKTGAEIKITRKLEYVAFSIPEDNPVIRRLKEVYAEMGIPVQIDDGGGGMDANRLNENGIVSVGVATGYNKNHSTAEYLEVEDLERSGELVEKLIRSYMQEL